jgi:nitric oxide reductase subunit B
VVSLSNHERTYVGAGLWGFAHTLPQINYYTHGSQVTVSHGHLAFYGAYAMLNRMVFYYAMPKLRGMEEHPAGPGKFGFWTMISAMFCLGLAFGIAGILQAYLERVLGFRYMATQEQMRLWFVIAFCCGFGSSLPSCGSDRNITILSQPDDTPNILSRQNPPSQSK